MTTLRNILLAMLLMASAACERDFSSAPATGDLAFSADTVSFDTIYAGFATPTARITLRNHGDNDLTISSIRLAGGEDSPFAVNIGGTSSHVAENVRLAHGDSLYIFVYAHSPRPADGRALTTIADQIIAEGGGNSWRTVLQAVVLNVCRVGDTIAADTQWLCDTIPYLVQDTLRVMPDARLAVGPGVTILMQSGAAIHVEGKLILAGDVARRSRVLPLRQDNFYEDIPGQWGRIRVAAGGEASLVMTDVACPTDGIVVDSAASLSADGLWLRDVSHSAIAARRATLRLVNTLITNSGGESLRIEGGDARLTHVTIANYFPWDARRVCALSVSRADSADATRVEVVNSIVVGNHSPEVEVDSVAGIATFRGSLIRADKKKVQAFEESFIGCQTASEAYFNDRGELDFHLSAKSAAVGLGVVEGAIVAPTDFEGRARMAADTIQAGAFQSIRY